MMTGSECLYPKLTTAKDLLPLVRHNLECAAGRSSLDVAIEVMPVVVDGLFGYELLPDGDTDTFLILGCGAKGTPILRTVSYRAAAPRLVVENGQRLARDGGLGRFRGKPHDRPFLSWRTACAAAMAELASPFRNQRRQGTTIRESVSGLERALAITSRHLARWDPSIRFFGVPSEEQLGYALTDTRGGRGTLACRQRSTWTLRWNTPSADLSATWPAEADNANTAGDRSLRDFPSADRRTRLRRAEERTADAADWAGIERRRGQGRRALDRDGH